MDGWHEYEITWDGEQMYIRDLGRHDPFWFTWPPSAIQAAALPYGPYNLPRLPPPGAPAVPTAGAHQPRVGVVGGVLNHAAVAKATGPYAHLTAKEFAERYAGAAASVKVARGQTYVLTATVAGCTDYGLVVFELTTAMPSPPIFVDTLTSLMVSQPITWTWTTTSGAQGFLADVGEVLSVKDPFIIDFDGAGLDKPGPTPGKPLDDKDTDKLFTPELAPRPTLGAARATRCYLCGRGVPPPASLRTPVCQPCRDEHLVDKKEEKL